MGKFKDARAPILAFYGANEPIVKPDDIAQMRAEMVDSVFPHEVIILPNAARALFQEGVTGAANDPDVIAWDKMLKFLDKNVLQRKRA
jgi:dienelactone hydrolase